MFRVSRRHEPPAQDGGFAAQWSGSERRWRTTLGALPTNQDQVVNTAENATQTSKHVEKSVLKPAGGENHEGGASCMRVHSVAQYYPLNHNYNECETSDSRWLFDGFTSPGLYHVHPNNLNINN